MASLSIRNLVKTTSIIQSRIGLPSIHKASRDEQTFLHLKEGLAEDIQRAVLAADRILSKSGEDPGGLGIRSRRAYQWLKFLVMDHNLEKHLDALQRINLFLPDVSRAKNFRPQQMDFHFYHLGSLFQVKADTTSIIITAQEILADAPDQVLIALLRTALNNEADGDKRLIHEYTFSPEYQNAREKLEYLGMKKGSQARGTHHDLRRSFQRVSERYFDGTISEPHLIWSSRLTHRKFGHYQWDIDTVLVSKTLDQSRVPAYVVDYVVFHELLHKKLGAKLVNQRRAVHTAAFREQEAGFEEIKQAQKWLTKLTRNRK